MKLAHEQRHAFTLVEVALAIGIFAFAIVAIMGLVSVSTTANRGASADTALVLMTQTSLNHLRRLGFAAINSTGYLDGTEYKAPNFYFDVDGRMAQTSDGQPDPVAHADSIYSCTVYAASTSSPSMIVIRLKFRWPVSAPVSDQQVRIVHSSIAKYD